MKHLSSKITSRPHGCATKSAHYLTNPRIEMKKPDHNRPNPGLQLTKPWVDNDNPIWLASTISLTRNIEKNLFPNKLNDERQKQLLSMLSKEVLDFPSLIQPKLILAESSSPLEKEYLVEHFLSAQGFQQTHSGEGFIIDETGQFLATLNIQDHLRLQVIDCQGELENSCNRLIKLETTIGKKLPYAFSKKFGFLTANPRMCGTGLVVTVFLQLPALIQAEKMEDVLEKYADESILVTGIQGNPTEIIGDVLAIQNNFTLGVTEDTIISTLRTLATNLQLEENRMRSLIRQTQDAHVKDQVSRAFGILIHSYQIEAVEALNAISLIKLGIEMEWIKGVTTKEINTLFFNCRRSHLLYQCGNHTPQDEIPHKRAEFIHKALKEAQLLT